jgi:hypothetical protein
VIWAGEVGTDDRGVRAVGAVHQALEKSPSVRPLDSAEDRRTLRDGGPAAELDRALTRAEAALAKLKCTDAIRDYEAAENLLLTEVPLRLVRARFADVMRGLLACYDQLGRKDDAARVAERLTFAPGTRDDVASLMARYHVPRTYGPVPPPVQIETEPAGAQVSRDLQPVGPGPVEVFGGEAWVDFVDAELEGYRRAHAVLGGGGTVKLVLQKEERLSALVDEVRLAMPDAPLGLVKAVGERVGAARVLVLAPDGAESRLVARWFDVAAGRWGADALHAEGDGAADKIALYVAPQAPVAAQVAAKPPSKKSRLGVWGKWYTWLAAGAVVALVAGLLIAEHVGDDKVHVTVSH